MNRINQSAECWENPEDWQQQVARAARVCYASEGGTKSDEDMCQMLLKRNHASMFRHGTKYYVIVVDKNCQVPGWVFIVLGNTPYAGCCYHKQKNGVRTYFVSANMQFVMENPKVMKHLQGCEVTLGEFVGHAERLQFATPYMLIRYTVCVTTQISTSRELNRTSPNNIAEQSTRYVNFGKRKGVTICTPHWWQCAHWSKRLLARFAWKTSELVYLLALRLGLPPQDARGFLALDAGTRVTYTYMAKEWKHILELRMVGTTGKPHPNAKIAATNIYNALLPAMQVYCGQDFTLM